MQKKDFLRTVDEGFSFKCCNGMTARNLYELLGCLERLTPAQFNHHVYFDHNDFSNWLFDVVEDEKLARKIYASNQGATIVEIKKRIEEIEKK